MISFLQDNQFASGLLATTLLAALLAYMRNIPQRIVSHMWAQFAVSAEIKNTDPAFEWLAMWLDQQPYSKKTRRLAVYTYNKQEPDEMSDEYVKHRKNRPKVLFTPAAGEHLFFYKGKLVWLSRTKADAASPAGPGLGIGGSSFAFDKESFNIWVLGRSQQTIREIIDDAMVLALPEGVPETCVIPSSDGRWQSPIRRKPRLSNSVILEGHIMDMLINDAKQFICNKAWYENLGIPYRRGYLLHGIPGSGKTSAVLALAGELELDVYMLNLGDRYLDDGRLNYLLSQIPPGNIVLLEDIDAAFRSRDVNGGNRPSIVNKRDTTTAEITFSGLLNALDGVAAREGRLLFMTTNYRDMLDSALVRPGRADVHIEFGYATSNQAERMFARFFPNASSEQALRFGHLTPKERVSMATIQDHLLTNKNNADIALAAWANMHLPT